MSTTIDERVLEMRFDNQDFERNVGRTMTTLEKLKQKLNLTGASKGLESVNTAAKNVNMNGLGSAVETVTAKFSALQVMGTTALVRITNQAMAAGEKMAKALTIDPIKTGFQEYETQINSVQTILANTSHNGTTIDQVNEALEELNKYADMTIYNFTEMTRNIGTFTAAGVDLETSVDSIKGIANLAAVSGSTSQQASTAMYQLSQALAAGKVSLMDWNSVVNAGMGGKVFQDALLRTSELLGTGGQAAVDAYGSFRESLSKGEWLTTEVLTETLKQFAGAYTEAELIQQGFSKEQAAEIKKMAETADEAATKVKTFTQLWDVMKEAAQSGWSQTWKLLIGDYEQAKELLTPISDFFTGVINGFSEARNAVIESALGKSFEKIGEAVRTITEPIENSAESIGEVVKTVQDYEAVVSEIIGGKWGNGQERWDKLTEAGYDWAHAQNLVNEKLGSSVRHATDYQEAQNGVAKSQEEVTEANAEYIASLVEKSDKQLYDMGLTFKQVSALRLLQKQSEKTGIPIQELVKDIDLLNGRTLMINSFKNIGQSILNIFKAMKTAWQDIFPPKSTEQKAQALYDLLAAFHKFTTYLNLVDDETGKLNETGQKFVRIFKGIFAVVDLVTTVLGGGLKIAFKLVSSVLKYFGMDALEVAAIIGDAIVKFHDWVEELINFDKIVASVIPMIKQGISAITKWVAALKEMPAVQNILITIKDAFSKLSEIDLSKIDLSSIFNSIKGAIEKLKGEEYSSIGEFIWKGLIVGLVKGAADAVKAIVEGARNLITAFCEETGIASPSKVFMALGGFIVAGLVLGIKEGIVTVPEALKQIVDAGIEAIKGIDLGAVMAIVFGAGLLSFFNKVGNALENFSAPFAGLGDILSNTADFVKKFGKEFTKLTKALKFNIQMKAIKQLAIGVAILAASVLAIAYIDKKYELDMWNAVFIIGALAAILVGLSYAMTALSNASISFEKGKFQMSGMTTGLLSMAASIAILALVVKLISTLSPEQAIGGFIGLAAIMGLLVGFIYLCGKVGDFKSAAVISKLGQVLIKLSIAILLMVLVCKLASKLTAGDMIKGGLFATALIIFVGILADITRDAKDIDKFGGMMIKMAIAMALMVFVCKLIAKLDPVEAIAGIAFAMAFTLFIKSLVKATKITTGEQIAKLGGLLIAVSFAMLLVVGVCKLVGMLSVDDLLKGAAFAIGFVIFVAALVKITKVSSEQELAKVSGTILAMATAIAILAVVCMLLSLMDTKGLVKGIIAVGFLSVFMYMMTKALNGANDVKGSMIGMAVAIGVMALAIGLLSFIDPKKLIGPTLAMGLLMGMFALIVKASAGVTKDAMATLIVMVVAIGVMAVIIGVLSALNVQNALQNAGAVALLMAAMTGVLFILSKTNLKVKDALKNIGLLTAMVIPMAAFVAVLHFMPDITAAKEKVIMLTQVMITMTALLAVLTLIGTFGKQAIKGVGLLALMAVAMAVFVAVIHFMPDITAAKEKVIMLTQVMITMTALLVVLTLIGVAAPLALAGIVALTAMIVPMMAFVAVMYFMPDITTAHANMNLLIGVMSVMTILLAQLAAIGPMALVGVAALGALTTVMVEVAIFAAALAGLNQIIPDLSTFLQTGLDLMIQIAGGIGEMIGAFVKGALTQIASGLPEIALHLSLFMMYLQPFINGARLIDESVIDGVKRIAAAILYLTAADFINGLLSGADGINSLPNLGTSLSKFIMNAFPFITLSKMIDPSVVEASKSLASIILTLSAADLISGIASLIPGSGGVNFESLGTTLTAFANAVVGFSNAITEGGGINPEAIDAAVKAGELMIKLQDSLPRSGGWVQEIIGEKDLSAFAASCIAFGQAMIDFSNAIVDGGGINEQAIEAASKAGTAMSELQNSLPRTGGWVQEICGEQDLIAFGASCVAFGTAMCNFSKSIADGGGVDVAAAEDAKEAGEIMLALQDSLPRSGGWVQDICGAEDLGAFGASCQAFGEALTSFSNNTEIDEDAVAKANNAGQMMIELQNAIPESKWFDGKMDLEDFGKKIVAFGEKMAAYSEKVAGMDTGTVDSSIAAATDLVWLAKAIANMDEIDTSNFKVDKIGTKMNDYYNEIDGIDAGVVKSSVNSAVELAKLIRSLVGLDTSGISSFNVSSLGKKMKSYAESVADLNTGSINGSIKAGGKLADFIGSLAGLNTSGVGTFKSAIESLSTISLDALAEAFNSSTIKKISSSGSNLVEAIAKGMKSKQSSVTSTATNMMTAVHKAITNKLSAFATLGRNLLSRLIVGMNTQRAKVNSAMTTTLSSAVTKARKYYDNFYRAGSYLVDGFSSGISENSYKAAAKAKAMAEAAYEAAKEELKINSPSKIFRALAYSVPEGFAMGIDRGSSMVVDSAIGMSDTAINSVRNTLSRVYDVINGDVDTQPTIRPVLDLSDVESGAGTIAGLFGNGASVGVMANLNAISSSMGGRNQNGANGDIVSAIDKLRSDISNLGGSSYTINGITYDDGSNIASAVESLTRAARIERRI